MNDELTKTILEAVQRLSCSYLPNFMVLHLIIGIVVIGLIILLGAYLRQKGKEYAKKEHIERLTKAVEDIKLNNKKEFEALAQENRLALSAFEQKNDLRLAALDKRLEVHQKTYSLWYRLISSVHKESELWDMLQECNIFWIENSLYLTDASRKAFDEAVRAASMHQAVKQEGDAVKTKENWNKIIKAGEIFVKSVSLPSLGEDEFLPSKPDKSKG